ncbi:MAG: hypothetical protein GY799_18455 [Desulfobulbaceae bacterium]|nr:hypothetical protein [Desulfobulbaceae bacterium]
MQSYKQQVLAFDGFVRPETIWLHGANCTGRAMSLVNLFTKVVSIAGKVMMSAVIMQNTDPC